MGKITTDRIRRTKKRAKQLVTDPAAALGDLEKHVQKTVGRQIKTTQKNINKTQEAVKSGFTTLVTSAGNLIKLRKNEIGVATAGVAVGMTISQAMKELDYPQLPEKEVVLQRMTYEDYLELAKTNPDDLTEEEWVGMISVMTRKLEQQLRFRLQLTADDRIGLFQLLLMAQQKNHIEQRDCNKLHSFRKDERNLFIHVQKEEITKHELIFWTADFVKTLENQTITMINS